MELSKYIKEILISRENVIIPNFGAFEKTMLSARIDPVTGAMHPPQVGVIFNRELTVDSGVLIKYVAEKEGIAEDKAAEDIQNQVKFWEDTLNQGQQVLLQGIGILTKDSSGSINYESSITAHDFPESYGLPVIDIKDKKAAGVQPEVVKKEPVKETVKVEEPKVEKKNVVQKKAEVKKAPVKQRDTTINVDSTTKKSNKGLIIALVIAVPVIALIVVIALNYDIAKKKFGSASKYVSGLLSGKNEVDTTSHKTAVITDTLNIPDSTNTETKAILENYTIIDESTNTKISPDSQEINSYKKVHIISGSFKTKTFANRQKNLLIKKGFKAEVLPENKGLFRVSVASFDDVASAAKDFERIKSIDESLNYWILVNK